MGEEDGEARAVGEEDGEQAWEYFPATGGNICNRCFWHYHFFR